MYMLLYLLTVTPLEPLKVGEGTVNPPPIAPRVVIFYWEGEDTRHKNK